MARWFLALAASAMLVTGLASAQSAPGTYGRDAFDPSSARDKDAGNQLGPENLARGATKAQIIAAVSELVKSEKLPCEVSDAALLNEGTTKVDGKKIHVRTFEAACSNGLGYFLVHQAPEKTLGFSCFAADATHDADVAQHLEPGPVCTLPANADRKAMAAKILSGLGQSCQVTAVHWIGQRGASELTEAACSGGNGYVITSAMPGASLPVSALTCTDSAKRGVPCKLSSNGAAVLDPQAFKAALVQHNVACNVQTLRVIGKQNVSQRHVVEFKCPVEQPNGLVAFIPAEGSTAPFEAMDCNKAASTNRIICTLTTP